MRFAIALLTVICIASVIGTVLKQHEPAVNYVNQFGPFWAELFLALKLNAVYSAWWFLLILAFLVVSTSLCIARNTPKYLADMRNYKENIREQSLQAFHHKAEADWRRAPEPRPGASAACWPRRLEGALQQRDTAARHRLDGGGQGRRGQQDRLHRRAQRHRAGVPGRLLDGDLIVRAQMWLGGKTPYAGGGMIRREARAPAVEPTRPSAATWWCPRARSPAPPS
jgi:cytochrome c biogenesis protein